MSQDARCSVKYKLEMEKYIKKDMLDNYRTMKLLKLDFRSGIFHILV